MARALSMCAQSGDVAGAGEIIRKMQASNAPIQVASLNLVLQACAKSADGQAAELWFSRIGQCGMTPNRASYCGVILAWVKGGNLHRSEHWIRKLYAAGLTTPKGFCRQLARKSISGASTGVVAKRAEQVTPWLGRLHHMGVPIDRSTVNLLMGAFARVGNITMTEQWAAFMEQASIPPNRSTFCALVTASRLSRDHQRASGWLARMEAFGFPPGDLETDPELGDADSDCGHPPSPPRGGPAPAPHARAAAAPRVPARKPPARGQQQQEGPAPGPRAPPRGAPRPEGPGPPCGTPPGLWPQGAAPLPRKVQLGCLGGPHSESGLLTPEKVGVPAPWARAGCLPSPIYV